MSRPGCALVVILVSSVMYAADPSPFVLPSVEDKYASAASTAEAVVAKAEAEAAKLRKAAAEIRLKAYKDRLAEVTKSGDFDKALAVKARIEELEKELEGDPKLQPKTPIRIVAAMYGVNQSWLDVTDTVQDAIYKKKQVVVSDAVFGDPAPEYQPGNTLIIRYERKGVFHSVAIYTGKPLLLP